MSDLFLNINGDIIGQPPRRRFESVAKKINEYLSNSQIITVKMNTPEISNRVLNTDELPKTSIKAAWKENLQVTVTVGDEPIVLHFDHSSGVTIVEGDGETQPTTIKIEDTSYTHSRLELTLA